MASPDRELQTTLPRVFGPFDACMVVVGSVIGSGIFLKPGIAAAELPSFGLIMIVWIGVGLLTLCGCVALAELATMLPQAGGPYVYLREAYGRLPAFLWGWTEFWIIRTGSIGALATATTIYLSEVVPLDRIAQEAVTIGLVVFLCAVNLFATGWVAHVQNLTSVLKLAFLALIIVLPYALGQAKPAHLLPLFPESLDISLWRGLGLAMIAVMWPYDGWINIGPVTEEIRDPQRNVPLALVMGFGLVILVYVAANISYHLVLPLEDIARSRAVVFDMFKVLLGEDVARWVALGVMCSTFGAVNANVLTGPRILFAVARDGLLPRAFQQVHTRYGTPANAILLQGAWATLLIFMAFRASDKPLDAFNALTDFVIFGGSVFYALSVASVFVLRRHRPELPRPYRTWGYPLTPALYLLAFGVAMVSLLVNAPAESLSGTLLIAAGVPYFYWMRGRSR
jgi:APA family basic amino acid/polyamine antiporter